MTDSYQSYETISQSTFLFEPQEKMQINDSSYSLEIYQTYEVKINEEKYVNEESSNNIQDFKQSKPFSVVMSVIDKKDDESINETCSIHYYNAKAQEQQFLSQNFPEMKRIKELEQEVEVLREENKELHIKLAMPNMQSGGVSYENSKAEEESGVIQAENAEPIDYKIKYLQYKQKCKYLMSKITGLEAIMKQKK